MSFLHFTCITLGNISILKSLRLLVLVVILIIYLFPCSVLWSTWSLQTRCFPSYGGLSGSIGSLQAVKLYHMMLLSFIGMPVVTVTWCVNKGKKIEWSFLSSSMLFSEMSIFFFLFLQAVNCFSGIWCFLCGLLCCLGLCDWNRCLLLPSLHYCYLICCNWSGMPCDHHGLLNTVPLFFLSNAMANALFGWY